MAAAGPPSEFLHQGRGGLLVPERELQELLEVALAPGAHPAPSQLRRQEGRRRALLDEAGQGLEESRALPRGRAQQARIPVREHGLEAVSRALQLGEAVVHRAELLSREGAHRPAGHLAASARGQHARELLQREAHGQRVADEPYGLLRPRRVLTVTVGRPSYAPEKTPALVMA